MNFSLIRSCTLILLLGACSQRFEPYVRFNKKYVASQKSDALLTDLYIYCGSSKEWREPIVHNDIFKDTIMNMLVRSLQKDSLIKLRDLQMIQNVRSINFSGNQLKYVLDSVISAVKITERRLIPIVYHLRYEEVNGVNAIQGHVARMYKNDLVILFCVKGESGIEYINGQQFWWIESDMHLIPKYLKQEHLDRLLARGLRKYKKAIRKSKQ